MAARVRRLVHELGAGVLASKEDAAAVDCHDGIPRIFRHLVYHSMVLGTAYTGIIDHAISSRRQQPAIAQSRTVLENTYTSSLPPSFTAVWTNTFTSMPIVTFVFTKMALPSPYRRQITSSVGVPACSAIKVDFGVGVKSAQTTRRAPWAAKARATARPRPEDEPVTMHTLPFKRVPAVKIGVEVAILLTRWSWNYGVGIMELELWNRNFEEYR